MSFCVDAVDDYFMTSLRGLKFIRGLRIAGWVCYFFSSPLFLSLSISLALALSRFSAPPPLSPPLALPPSLSPPLTISSLFFSSLLPKHMSLRCSKITDDGLAALPNWTLRALDISDLPKITDAGIERMAESVNKSLKAIDMSRSGRTGHGRPGAYLFSCAVYD